MTPEYKKNIIKTLKQVFKKYIGFCGDGANDCPALKKADLSNYLSQAEASIAAPFTSKEYNINCVVKLLREARAALDTCMKSFKYLALYSLIQFFTIVLLYSELAEPNEY